MSTASNSFSSLKSRWDTELGKQYLLQIKKIIETSSAVPNSVINFLDLTAPKGFEGTDPNKRDLAFINLNGLEIENCTLKNAYLSRASIVKSKLSNIQFENCYIDEANLSNSEFYKLTFNEDTTLNGTNFKGTQIIECSFNDYNIKKAISYSKPSYTLIVLKAFLKFICIDISYRRHTLFESTDISNLNSWVNKELKEHIIWYEHLMYRIEKIHNGGLLDSPKLLFSVITTFYWSSYTVLACWAIAFNAFMAYKIKSLPPESFEGINGDFGSAFYYSIVTFTTLGYGDIHPCPGVGMFYAGTIAVVGYVVLGVLIYLIARKVDKKF